MQVQEVMSRDVVTIDIRGTLREVTRELLANDVGSVVVTVDDMPAGIVTEHDLAWAGYETDEPFSRITVEEVVSRPIKSIGPKATLHEAADIMQDENVRRLVVVDGTELLGVVSMTDLVHQHGRFLSAARNLDAQRRFISEK